MLMFKRAFLNKGIKDLQLCDQIVILATNMVISRDEVTEELF